MDHEYALGNFPFLVNGSRVADDLGKHARSSPGNSGASPWRPSSATRGPVIVVHHLGTNYRRNPRKVSRYCRRFGAVEVTDSLDLMVLGNLPWLPAPADINRIAVYRAEHPTSKRILIAHAPTNRAIKSTELIIETVGKLAEKYTIEFDLIERVSNDECLQRKAQADIFVDELTLGFGLNNIECWAMGIPVVSGLKDPKARDKALGMWGEFPWHDATEETLYRRIEELIVSPNLRREMANRGMAHVMRWHSEKAVVEQTLAVYERAGMRVAA